MYMYMTKFTEAVSALPSWAVLKLNDKNAAILALFELSEKNSIPRRVIK